MAGTLVHRLTGPTRDYLPPWRVVGAISVPIIVLAAVEVTLRGSDASDPLERGTILLAAAALGGAVIALVVRPRLVRVLAAGVILGAILADPTGRYLGDITGDARRDQLLGDRIVAYTVPNGAAVWLQERLAAGETFRYYGYDPALLVNDDVKRTYHVSYQEPETQSILVNNRSVGLGLQDVQGYNPVQIARYVDYFEAINADDQSYHAANVLYSGWDSPLLDMLNVRYLVVPGALAVRDPDNGDLERDPRTGQPTWVQTLPAGRPDLLHISQRLPTVYRDQTNRVLESATALPRAWLVHRADEVELEDQLARWQLRLVDPAETALTEPGVELTLESPPEGVVEAVTLTASEPDEIRLRVDAGSRGLVVLSEVWDPGWEAEVNGEAVEVVRVNYLMRGIVVEGGTSEIVLHYDPPILRESLLIALGGATLVLLTLVTTWAWERRRPRRPSPSDVTLNLPRRLG